MNKLKISFVFFILLGFQFNVWSQTDIKPYKIRDIMLKTPDSLTYSAQNLANYIESNFNTQNDKAFAAYLWIVDYISYDIDSKFDPGEKIYTNEEIENILKSRKGICQDYSHLYSDLANKLGIKSYVVTGYVKMNGVVIQNPHSWNVSLIDSVWYLTDPTWGAGLIKGDKFEKKIDYKYFKVIPQKFIKTHIPFDPIWQLLDYPITKNMFFGNHKNKLESGAVYFNFVDSIALFNKQSEIEQKKSIICRARQNGISNYLDYDYIYHLDLDIKMYYKNLTEEQYYNALVYFNEGIYQFNKFIEYRNNQFLPYKNDIEIKGNLEEIDELFTKSLKQLNEIKQPSLIIKNSISQLKVNIKQAQADLVNQKEKLDVYFETFKEYRLNLSRDSLIN